MGFQLEVLDPFIVTFHHQDIFPVGNSKMEPQVIPTDKNIGEDFDHNADWRMYYGTKVPGFPVHPHRGFETVTIMEEGFVDHFDSKGSKGRYGKGDVQWMTAGKGVQHSEMFPVLDQTKENPMELFQVWLNLEKKKKFAEPAYKMLWNEDIPIVNDKDENGNPFSVKIVTGCYAGVQGLEPLPASWAFDRDHHVNIWIIKLDKNATFTIPASTKTVNRMIYNYKGGLIYINKTPIANDYSAQLVGDKYISIQNGEEPTSLLLLEGEPINEPVAANGPFVMNYVAEIKQAYIDYQQTEFGGWPWNRIDPVNNLDDDRFASHNNGQKVERPKK